MIPDLLQIPQQVRQYIFQRTGVRISKYKVQYWIKTEQISSFKISSGRTKKRVTTKRAVNKFIRRNIREEISGSEKQRYNILSESHKRIRDSKKPNSNSLVQ